MALTHGVCKVWCNSGGGMYEGDFLKGMRHGNGKFTHEETGYSFIGTWCAHTRHASRRDAMRQCIADRLMFIP